MLKSDCVELPKSQALRLRSLSFAVEAWLVYPANFSCANPTSSIPSCIEQDGDRQGVANGESSTEVPSVCTSSVFDTAAGTALLEIRVRIGDRNASSPYPRLDRNAAIVARQRRLGAEAASAG